jgi:hypothetical protein
MKFTGENRSTRGKTCPSANLSTTNPIWTDPGSNPGLPEPWQALCEGINRQVYCQVPKVKRKYSVMVPNGFQPQNSE